MQTIDLELSAHPAIALTGFEAGGLDVQGETLDTWATGFLYEGKGFSVSAKFPNPILLRSHEKRWDGSRVYLNTDGERDVVAAIQKLWPGMAVHA